MKIELDMYQTLAVAVLVLMLGKFLRARVQVLERFCIPAPVIGGVLFAIFTCVCYGTGIAEFAFDMISPKGISYLHENSTIQKVKRSVKGIADIVGNINPL